MKKTLIGGYVTMVDGMAVIVRGERGTILIKRNYDRSDTLEYLMNLDMAFVPVLPEIEAGDRSAIAFLCGSRYRADGHLIEQGDAVYVSTDENDGHMDVAVDNEGRVTAICNVPEEEDCDDWKKGLTVDEYALEIGACPSLYPYL